MEKPVSDNPLLDFSGLPRFSAIKPDHVAPALDCLLSESRREIERLLSAADAYTWDNFAQPIEDMQERLHRMWSPVSHLNSVTNGPELRAAYNAGLPRVKEFFTDLSHDERVYAAYKAIAKSPEFAKLSPPQKKIIENTLRDFRLAGAELRGDAKRRFKEIERDQAMLSNRFAENVLDATQAWELLITDIKDLAGLPESARAMARQAAEEDRRPGWKFTLEGPSYIAFMSYADHRDLRRRMYEAYVTRASDHGPHAGQWDNSELITRILRLRQEKARLLGFSNYAEYALQTRMAKRVEQVMEFLHDLAARARPAAQKELDELRQFACTHYGTEELEAWDLAYCSEKLRQYRYAFSQEDVRPYLPEDRVLAGMFEIVKRLYGLEINQADDAVAWHPDVRLYEIREPSGELRGRFYLDLYTRANKRGGAWMDECISRRRTTDGVQVPAAYLVCNFSRPIGDQPALFTHEEVTTLFHEFGHGLHHMLTKVDYVGVAGLNGVAWDAVELPSQLMENWCWEREALDLVARHYRTGAPIPDELHRKMQAAKNFHSGLQFVRQLEFAMFDMRLHSDYDPRGEKSVQEVLDEVRAEVAVVVPPSYNRFQTSFLHIFAGGYAAGYYSYKWAEVLSADAFGKFEENGIFHRQTGREFLHHVLEQGGVREAMDLFVQFRGREPRIDALLRHSGLVGA